MQSREPADVALEIEIEGPVQACANCGGPEVSSTNVRSAFWHGDRLVVVDDIPALVCQTCGEQYFDDRTVVRLDLLRGTGFPADQAEAKLTVPVFSLRNRPLGESEDSASDEEVLPAEATG